MWCSLLTATALQLVAGDVMLGCWQVIQIVQVVKDYNRLKG